jgi:alkanesulfonate monooxygenase SsuD/methylene tetrahydromethanopterin reductase-like flavin-dependent oxidoreductase (luciferase family)
VWHAFGSPEQIGARSRDLDRLTDAAGRDPASIARASNLSISEPMDQVKRTVDAFRDAGVDYLVVGWPGEGTERVEEFAGAFADDLTP